MKRGFTVVELLITMAVMAILLGLAVVNMRSTLANGRDTERKNDIATLARGLELRYNNGNPVLTSPVAEASQGTYPSANEMLHAQGTSQSGWTPSQVVGGYIKKDLPGVSGSALTGPNGNAGLYVICSTSCAQAGDTTQINTAFGSGTTQDRYVYEPTYYDASRTSQVCLAAPCTGYNLYWLSETDSTTYLGIAGLKVWESKHQ